VVRSKKGKAAQERVDEITKSPAFDRIRQNHPERLKKIMPLVGDITLENFGMTNEDLESFNNEVNFIFHSAASVKLNDPIKTAIFNNTLPTKRLIAMAKKVKNLDVSFTKVLLKLIFKFKKSFSELRSCFDCVFKLPQ
jgi:fatty acyl-CoA reductase